jgi:hypothetical protein
LRRGGAHRPDQRGVRHRHVFALPEKELPDPLMLPIRPHQQRHRTTNEAGEPLALTRLERPLRSTNHLRLPHGLVGIARPVLFGVGLENGPHVVTLVRLGEIVQIVGQIEVPRPLAQVDEQLAKVGAATALVGDVDRPPGDAEPLPRGVERR